MPEVTDTTTKLDGIKNEPMNSTEASDNGVSSTSPEKNLSDENEGAKLLLQGKRYLYVKDYPNAVNSLGDACSKLSEMFGDLADDCGEAYFNYGRALLGLAREESNVLGTDPDREESEEDEEGVEDEDSKPEETDEAEALEEGGSKQNQEESNVHKENNKNGNQESPADETIDTTKEISEEEVTGEEKEEDVDNLQLAWEVLELAKKIFERQKSDEKLADTYFYLGEVGLEAESYSCAIDDLKQCVEIRKKFLPPHHRDIAETYFQLGVACSLCNDFDEAVENFKRCSDILKARIKYLQENGTPEVDNSKNPFYTVEKEITEIEALLPEINTKIADMEDFKQETIKNMVAALKGQSQPNDDAGTSSGPSSSSVANGTTPKPATDISHLVRKKRKPEGEISSENCVKKSCTDETDK